jgi:hypothetical protein
MNEDLVEKAVKYHGKELFDLILKQNNCDSHCESGPSDAIGIETCENKIMLEHFCN